MLAETHTWVLHGLDGLYRPVVHRSGQNSQELPSPSQTPQTSALAPPPHTPLQSMSTRQVPSQETFEWSGYLQKCQKIRKLTLGKHFSTRIGDGNEPAASIIICCCRVVVAAEGISASTSRVVAATDPAPVFSLHTLTVAVVLRLWIPTPSTITNKYVVSCVHAWEWDRNEFWNDEKHSPAGCWVVKKKTAIVVTRNRIKAACARHAVATAHTATIDFRLSTAITEAVDRN